VRIVELNVIKTSGYGHITFYVPDLIATPKFTALHWDGGSTGVQRGVVSSFWLIPFSPSTFRFCLLTVFAVLFCTSIRQFVSVAVAIAVGKGMSQVDLGPCLQLRLYHQTNICAISLELSGPVVTIGRRGCAQRRAQAAGSFRPVHQGRVGTRGRAAYVEEYVSFDSMNSAFGLCAPKLPTVYRCVRGIHPAHSLNRGAYVLSLSNL